jgi:hypothetical protein
MPRAAVITSLRTLKAAMGPGRGWKRLAGAAALGLAGFGGLALAQLKPDTTALKVQLLAVSATPIASFDRENPAKSNFGKLTWRGGLVLTSEAENFGGWSGLAMAPDGQTFVAVSDAGTWMEGQIAYDGRTPTGIKAARTGPLKARDGSALSKKRDRDAEAVVLTSGKPGSGSLLIAFEQNDRIGRFASAADGIAAPSAYVDMPTEAKAMRVDGFEAVTVFSSGPNAGNMIAFAERARSGNDKNYGWIWQNGLPKPLLLGGMAGFDVTDVASHSNGDLLVLERRFRWTEGVKMRIRLIKASAIRPGAVLDGEVLMSADLSQEIDNMEGLSVSRGSKGETVLTLISDDNFNSFLQRTVLLQFTLNE